MRGYTGILVYWYTMSLFGAKSITEDDRKRIIIEFIRSKPYCNAEEVVQGVKDDISRVTVFKVLRRLIESGAVKSYLENEQKRNARDHKLFVDEGNPLVSVHSELDKFQKAYFDLCNKMAKYDSEIKHVRKQIHDLRENNKVVDDVASDNARQIRAKIEELDNKANQMIGKIGRIFLRLFRMFYYMVDAYLFRSLSIWPKNINDKRVLQQLYSMVFSRIADMQTHISEILNSLDIVEVIETSTILLIRDRFRTKDGAGLLEGYSTKAAAELKEDGELIERVIDSLWSIFGELQPIVYPEVREFGWPFEFGKDDWRKLHRLLLQDRESNPRRDWDEYLSKIFTRPKEIF